MVNILSIIIGILVVAILIMRESHKLQIAEHKRGIRTLNRVIHDQMDTIANLEDELETARESIVSRNQEILKMIEGYKNDCRKG